MAYQTYITEAIVCGSNPHRSADRSYLLFTKEAGMVYAHAQSVREERSKQRYALQECSHVRVTLVRGKSGWRIRGAEPIQNLYARATTRASRAFLRNIVLLLRRVIHGEIEYTNIFDDVMLAMQELGKHPEEKLERILSLRVLHALGYVSPASPYEKFLHCSMPYDLDDFTDVEEKSCKEAIEKALRESQL